MARRLTRRNFLFAGSLGLIGTLSSVGCGGAPTTEQEEPEKAEQPEEIEKHAVGETVETDLVKLTLNDAAFTIALNNSLPIGADFNIDNDYFCPKEYVAEEDANNAFVAPKGSTLVFYELVIENLDRDYLDLDGFGTKSEFVAVAYEGETYTEFEEREYGWAIRDLDGEQDWDSTPVTNILASVGVRDLYRAYATVPFEPASLSDPFDISFTLPCSDDTTQTFTFAINQ
ncbi:hypothetical protein H6A07_05820 [Olsenella uli]|uniref:hypothetical protein n=1 Tax=Olsenella uli TaxID=133926 RepID=UPI00195AB06C|nr:hypothetical protein [Olsenella uli]MBM6676259.1 hypothetical protein [Olsenella uli]